MKKISILFIILLIIISFNLEKTNADDNWILNEILNLEYGPFQYELSLPVLDEYTFNNNNLQNRYNTFIKFDKISREQIIIAYKNWDYDYYRMNWIVMTYSNFVYNVNKFFFFLDRIDSNPSIAQNREIQFWVLKFYKASYFEYNKLQNLLKR